MKAVPVAAEPALRESLAGLRNLKSIRQLSELNAAQDASPEAATRHTLRLLARRVMHLTEEIADLTARITTATDAYAPKLLNVDGVGPDTAAALLTAAGDNPGRLGSEASFAAADGRASYSWAQRFQQRPLLVRQISARRTVPSDGRISRIEVTFSVREHGQPAAESGRTAADAGSDVVYGRIIGVGGRQAPVEFRRTRPKVSLVGSRVYWTLAPHKLFRRAG
ncbi:hypothetical protein ACWD6P_07745 [Streptomyces sp. NPDC002446]